jgi:hypothetical protein
VWINAVLTSPSLWFIARVGLTAAYWVTGLQQLFGWTDAVAEMRSFALRARASDYRGGDCREDWRRDSRDSGFFRMAWGGALGVFTLQAILIAIHSGASEALSATRCSSGFVNTLA